MNEYMILMSKSRGSHGEDGRAVQQGVKKVFGNTRALAEKQWPLASAVTQGRLGHPPQVHGKVYEGQRVCAALDFYRLLRGCFY